MALPNTISARFTDMTPGAKQCCPATMENRPNMDTSYARPLCGIRHLASMTPCKRLQIAFALVVALAPQAVIAAPGGVALVPHRAVYDMVLQPTAGVPHANIGKGRMVYEIRGAACAGYTVSMRWVTQSSTPSGEDILDDLQYMSWEAGDGDNFTFSSTRFVNRHLAEEMESSATKGKDGGAGEIRVSKPKKYTVPLPAGTIFPTEHIRLVIADALAGKSLRNDRLYDVSDDGKSIYDTFTLITPLGESDRANGVAKVPSLEASQGWSANVSYFLKDKKGGGEVLPQFEQNFSLFANGVSTAMRLGTPTVIIDAKLTEIEFFPPAACDKKAE